MAYSERNKRAANEQDVRRAETSATEFFPSSDTVRAVLEDARIGIWNWDIGADKVTWSSNLEAMHHMPAGSFDGSYDGFESAVHCDDRQNVQRTMKDALRSHAPFHTRYRIAGRADEADSWLEASATVQVKDGATQHMLGVCRDITERVNLESELRNRARQQEALAQLGERALVEPDLDRLLNDAVSTMAMTLAVDFVKVLELLPGDGNLLLRAGFGWQSALVGTIVTTTEAGGYARHTLDSRLPVVTDDFAAETRFHAPGYLLDSGCVSAVSATIAGPDDRAYGILAVCSKSRRHFNAQDIAFLVAAANLLAGAIQRRLLEERNELMIRDMRHRSGNMFSQLLALFSQTARTSKNIPELASKYQARVLAVANAHRLITEGGWKTIPIMDLFHVLFGPYLDRITFDGPNVELEPDPVFHLSAALHELTDNAIKHGSLSRTKGHLDLGWSVCRTQRGMTLILDWVEKNGPPARQSKRLGFGSRLIGLVIERQLNGEVTRSFTSKGLSVHMVVPLTRERWPTAATATAADHT